MGSHGWYVELVIFLRSTWLDHYLYDSMIFSALIGSYFMCWNTNHSGWDLKVKAFQKDIVKDSTYTEGHCHLTSSKGEFHCWPLPSQKEFNYGIHAAKTCIFSRTDVATQTEFAWKYAAIKASDCEEWQSLSLVTDGSHENCCVSCGEVHDLLSLVLELWEEAETLRRIRETEKERE